MSGFNVLWLPGTDHAGIATQNVVEKQLSSAGIDRHTIGRNAFTEHVWKWKSTYGGKIIHQLKKLGASCDWSRERFTLDEGLSKAVGEVFVKLYEEGLIYRDNRLINWCPRCDTALSDLEVEHDEVDGTLTYIRYPFSHNTKKYITVATTRPETMLGDTAVAVHPKDKRYKKIIGASVNLPLTGRKIVIIADPAVDPSFGTGAVKITPAHDFNDEAIAKNQKPPLESITVIGADGRMTPEAGDKYERLDRYECRKHILKDLKKRKLLEKETPYKHAVGHCYRCKTTTEPLLTPQWYVNVQSMATDAVKVVKEKRIQIIPQSWENTYYAWMEHIKDWCISRQIWWGHRIPVWYCQETKNKQCKALNGIVVSRDAPGTCPHCGSKKLIQDEDVLDTWFSSALWPFSTLGWPDQTEDLKTFYPTNVLVTGFDIIFFWVARMIMMGLKFMKDVPFRDVYIHALVRDIQGQKMSKSKGNVVDPLVMIDRYGTDAFRFTLAAFAAQGRDIKFSEERVEGYKHFVNKLWNAARFIMINTESFTIAQSRAPSEKPVLHDQASKWIISRLAFVTDDINSALDDYRFNDAANTIYQFIWHEFCDWYLEMAKSEMKKPKAAPGVKWCLVYTLETALRLLHPLMPFVTEEIWQKIPHGDQKQEGTSKQPGANRSIMVSRYPHALHKDPKAEENMSYIIEAITGIRTIRGELNISPSLHVKVSIKTFSSTTEKILNKNLHYIKDLAKVDKIGIGMDIGKPECSATAVRRSMEIYIPLKGILNINAEVDRLNKDIAKIEESILFLNKKLLNEDFLQRAPGEIVEKEKAKYEKFISMKERILESISMLKDAEASNGIQE
jgi:valyl-tRNA synthetase